MSRYRQSKGQVSLDWAGEDLVLLPERALWWDRGSTIFIADPHFGKASTFRLAGIAVPELSHAADLRRLDSILQRTGAERLVILGDFIHAKPGHTKATLGALGTWRSRHATLHIILVKGNHDRHAGPPPDDLDIRMVNGPWGLWPFECCHEPQNLPNRFTLAGHLHPSFRISERIGSGVKGPCFYFAPSLAVLPAFGSFTGTRVLQPNGGERIFITGPDQVIDVSAAIRRPPVRTTR